MTDSRTRAAVNAPDQLRRGRARRIAHEIPFLAIELRARKRADGSQLVAAVVTDDVVLPAGSVVEVRRLARRGGDSTLVLQVFVAARPTSAHPDTSANHLGGRRHV